MSFRVLVFITLLMPEIPTRVDDWFCEKEILPYYCK